MLSSIMFNKNLLVKRNRHNGFDVLNTKYNIPIFVILSYIQKIHPLIGKDGFLYNKFQDFVLEFLINK